MKPSFFASAAELRAWLRKHHAEAAELWIGFYKAGSGGATVSYKEALDEALCHGWIDGVRKTIDDIRWTIRFTPRKASSHWSQINLKRAAELRNLGRMAPAGRRAHDARDRRPAKGYSYENQPKRLAPAREKVLRADRAAWVFFEAQPPSYRRKAYFWVESAVKEETRERRLLALIAAAARGQRLGPLAGQKG